jgi:hypothetical protein
MSGLRCRILAGGGQYSQQHVRNMSRKHVFLYAVLLLEMTNRSEPNTGTFLWSVLAALHELRGSRYSQRFRRGSALTGCDAGSFG